MISSHAGGWASSQTKIAAQTGARWVIASTPAAHVSETAGTLTDISVQVLIDSATTEPSADPVASDGVSIPPTAPARRNSAVSSGFNNRMTAAAPRVRPLFTLTVRMLLPLPGSSGHQIEQIPVTSPAAATDGISTHDLNCTFGRAIAITALNARPTAAASGAMASARN